MHCPQDKGSAFHRYGKNDSVAAAPEFHLKSGSPGKKIYVCSILITNPSAVVVSLNEGSSNVCATSNQAAVIGVATTGVLTQGVSLAANSGWAIGNGGGTVAQTQTASNYLCLMQSSATFLAGNISFVQQ